MFKPNKTAIVMLAICFSSLILGCGNQSRTPENSGTTESGAKPNESGNPAENKSIVENKTQAPKKAYLDAESYKLLDVNHQYNVLYFKFNKEALNKPETLAYWIALNSCEKASLSNNEFEWPNIEKEYKSLIDTTLEKIPTAINVNLIGYLGQYDKNTQSFPLLRNVLAKSNDYIIGKIDLSGGMSNNFCYKNPSIYGHSLNFSQPLNLSSVKMGEENAKEYVAQHSDPGSRDVILSIDSEVTGLLNSNGTGHADFIVVPKKIKVLDKKNKDIVLYEFDTQVTN